MTSGSTKPIAKTYLSQIGLVQKKRWKQERSLLNSNCIDQPVMKVRVIRVVIPSIDGFPTTTPDSESFDKGMPFKPSQVVL